MNILLPWELNDENVYIRKCYSNAIKTRFYALGFVGQSPDDKLWQYSAFDLEGKTIFEFPTEENVEAVDSKEEAQKIVDDALIKAGWQLLNKEDKLMVLI